MQTKVSQPDVHTYLCFTEKDATGSHWKSFCNKSIKKIIQKLPISMIMNLSTKKLLKGCFTIINHEFIGSQSIRICVQWKRIELKGASISCFASLTLQENSKLLLIPFLIHRFILNLETSYKSSKLLESKIRC
jgi:hypothetical protein